MRAEYLKAFPSEGSAPDIVHVSIGRFLQQISQEQHTKALDEIEAFNVPPFGSVTFSEVKMFYEKRYWLSDVEPLAAIPLSPFAPSKPL